MGDETPIPMNLDLNLAPDVLSSTENNQGLQQEEEVSMNLEDFLQGPVRRLREAIRQRRQQWRSIWGPFPISPEIWSNEQELVGESGLQTGEGSVPSEPEENSSVVPKACDNTKRSSDGVALRKNDVGKRNRGDGSFFDCSICLDLVRDPVVTCCGHLFCWSCLYRWLYVHSEAKECPVCKGEVTIENVTPIYGRGNDSRVAAANFSVKIPLRPPAQRVESWRETVERAAFDSPLEEMVRRIGIRFGITRDLSHLTQAQAQILNDRLDRLESPAISHWILNRILSSSGLRRELNTVISPDVLVDLTSTILNEADVNENHQPILSNFISALLSDIDSDIRNGQVQPPAGEPERNQEQPLAGDLERNQEQPPAGDVRDSDPVIASVIQPNIQLVETAVESTSFPTHFPTHSYRTRSNAWRFSDVGSGDSPPRRRRRLN